MSWISSFTRVFFFTQVSTLCTSVQNVNTFCTSGFLCTLGQSWMLRPLLPATATPSEDIRPPRIWLTRSMTPSSSSWWKIKWPQGQCVGEDEEECLLPLRLQIKLYLNGKGLVKNNRFQDESYWGKKKVKNRTAVACSESFGNDKLVRFNCWWEQFSRQGPVISLQHAAGWYQKYPSWVLRVVKCDGGNKRGGNSRRLRCTQKNSGVLLFLPRKKVEASPQLKRKYPELLFVCFLTTDAQNRLRYVLPPMSSFWVLTCLVIVNSRHWTTLTFSLLLK